VTGPQTKTSYENLSLTTIYTLENQLSVLLCPSVPQIHRVIYGHIERICSPGAYKTFGPPDHLDPGNYVAHGVMHDVTRDMTRHMMCKFSKFSKFNKLSKLSKFSKFSQFSKSSKFSKFSKFTISHDGGVGDPIPSSSTITPKWSSV
jgi:hypothetical protein